MDSRVKHAINVIIIAIHVSSLIFDTPTYIPLHISISNGILDYMLTIESINA